MERVNLRIHYTLQKCTRIFLNQEDQFREFLGGANDLTAYVLLKTKPFPFGLDFKTFYVVEVFI